MKKRGVLSWVIEFAGRKKSYFGGSVTLAILGVAASFVPYLITADIVGQLLSLGGNVVVRKDDRVPIALEALDLGRKMGGGHGGSSRWGRHETRLAVPWQYGTCRVCCIVYCLVS